MWSAVTSPSTTDLGTSICSDDGRRGLFLFTTRRLSFAIDATCKYLLTSLILVCFFEGRVPWFKWACVRLRSVHSDWIWIQA